ncbi:hypothetical protein [Streptomyces sp. NPDC054794]
MSSTASSTSSCDTSTAGGYSSEGSRISSGQRIAWSTSAFSSTQQAQPLPAAPGELRDRHRIKMLKRQMFGRAGFAVLRKRVLLA